MVSFAIRIAVVAFGVTSFGSAASARVYELVHPRICLAGTWGKPVLEWRIQLGLFDDERKAVKFSSRLAKAKGKIPTEHYIAIWRQRGDKEPIAVVTRTVYKNAKAARRAVQKIRKAGYKAFVRRYRRYR